MPRAMDRGMWMDYLSSTAMLGCAACQRRIDLSLGSGLVFAGVFGAWVAFRPRYEPGRWRSTLLWTFFGVLTFLPLPVVGLALWAVFLAPWTMARTVGAIRERGQRGPAPLPDTSAPPIQASTRRHFIGFNAGVLAFFALAIVLRLGTLRLSSGSVWP